MTARVSTWSGQKRNIILPPPIRNDEELEEAEVALESPIKDSRDSIVIVVVIFAVVVGVGAVVAVPLAASSSAVAFFRRDEASASGET